VIATLQRLDRVELAVQAHRSGDLIAVAYEDHGIGRILGGLARILSGFEQLRAERAFPNLRAVRVGLELDAPRGGHHALGQLQRDAVRLLRDDVALHRRDAQVFGAGALQHRANRGRGFQQGAFDEQSIIFAMSMCGNR
jgi:hypothetical protein